MREQRRALLVYVKTKSLEIGLEKAPISWKEDFQRNNVLVERKMHLTSSVLPRKRYDNAILSQC